MRASLKVYFLGFANLRGEIIGLIDLRVKFGFKAEFTPFTTVIVFETQSGLLGAITDRILKIARFEKDNIEFKPHIKTRIPQDYLIGICKNEEDDAILIHLQKILNEDDWNKIKELKAS